jgi:hypothetical protein
VRRYLEIDGTDEIHKTGGIWDLDCEVQRLRSFPPELDRLCVPDPGDDECRPLKTVLRLWSSFSLESDRLWGFSDSDDLLEWVFSDDWRMEVLASSSFDDCESIVGKARGFRRDEKALRVRWYETNKVTRNHPTYFSPYIYMAYPTGAGCGKAKATRRPIHNNSERLSLSSE